MAGDLEVHVTFSGVEELENAIADLATRVPGRIEEEMKSIGDGAKNFMDAHTPVKTGKLKSGNQVEVTRLEMTVSNNVEYAPYVNYGTRYMSAHPFFEPTLEYIMRQLGHDLERALQ